MYLFTVQNREWKACGDSSGNKQASRFGCPFCHFDRDGQIAFQAYPESSDALPALRAPGSVESGITFAPPKEARGKDFSVYAGLWSPGRKDVRDHEERLLPDKGEADRRVLLGRLHVDESGRATWEAIPKTP
jgi:hypothetical protein